MKRLLLSTSIAIGLFSSNAFSALHHQGQAWSNGVIPYQFSTSSTDSLDDPSEGRSNIEWAIQHYEDNTELSFQPATSGQRVIIRKDLDGDGRADASIGRNCFIFCFSNHLDLYPNSSKATALHELFHTVGFKHEQTRGDREQYLEVASGSSTSTNSDWAMSVLAPWLLPMGNLDLASTSLYPAGLDVAAKALSPQMTLEILSQPASFEREFRIVLPDATPSSGFDNQFLNNQSDMSALEVSNQPHGHWSPIWDFIYVGGGNQFLLKGKHGKGYINNGGGATPTIISSASAGTSSAIWTVEAGPTSFKISNNSSGVKKFLSDNSGSATLTSNSNSATQWSIQVVSFTKREKLSDMDIFSIHQVYGKLFRIQLSDQTKERADNITLNIEDHYFGNTVEGGTLPISDNNNGWHSAMWVFERVGSYFRIKNLWTQEYLHLEHGFIERDPAGTTNYDGVDINYWHSAQWDLEINYKDGGFRINNRWNGQYLKLNSNGTLGFTIDSYEASNWDLPAVNWSEFQ